MKTEKEVILEACGVNDEGDTKAVVSVKLSEINAGTMEEKVLDEVILDNPTIQIYRSVKYTMVDLIFDNPMDFEFIKTFGRLSGFCNEVGEDMNSVRTIIVTISPKRMLGEYFLCGMHAAWLLMKSKPQTDANMIRFVFDGEHFNVFYAGD